MCVFCSMVFICKFAHNIIIIKRRSQSQTFFKKALCFEAQVHSIEQSKFMQLILLFVWLKFKANQIFEIQWTDIMMIISVGWELLIEITILKRETFNQFSPSSSLLFFTVCFPLIRSLSPFLFLSTRSLSWTFNLHANALFGSCVF